MSILDRPAPPSSVHLRRISGHINTLQATGVARLVEDGLVEVSLTDDEAARGGIVSVSLPVPVRCAPCADCGGTGARDVLFSAWLTLPAGAVDGLVVEPSVSLPDALYPVRFRFRR